MKKFFLTLIIFFFITPSWAAQHTGNPKNTLGSVRNGIYTNTITTYLKNGRFSIIIPQYADKPLYDMLSINENINPHQTLVSFGRTPNNFSFYRVVITKMPPAPLNDDAAAQVLNASILEAEKLSKNISVVKTTKTTIGKNSGYYFVYNQTVKEDNSISSFISGAFTHRDVMYQPQTFTHVLFLTQIKDNLVLFWFQGTNYKQFNDYYLTQANYNAILHANYTPFNNFIKSFKLVS